jgi:hypothetical protein
VAITVGGDPPPGRIGDQYDTTLAAVGGTSPYQWTMAGGTLPSGLQLDGSAGTISGVPGPGGEGTSSFTVRVSDAGGVTAEHVFSLMINPAGETSEASDSSRARLLGVLGHTTTWLAFLALWVPAFGAVWVVVYAFATPGSHWAYVAVGMLTSIAALVIGYLVGFLFGIPRVVSSGALRHGTGASDYTPSSNLAEVSDWLTKLLLGAGLVQLTRLGVPISGLIDNIAAGLHSSAASVETAKVAAGAILFGYVVIGILDGYVVTTLWYQSKIAKQ